MAEHAEREVVEARADRRGERDHEQQHRECHRDLRHARDDGVAPAAEVAGDRAHHDPDDHHPQGREQRHLERDLRTVEKPQELVLTECVGGTEDEERGLRLGGDRVGVMDRRPRPGRLERRRGHRLGSDEDLVRAVAEHALGDRRAHEGGQDQTDDGDPADDRDLVAAEADPDELPIASRSNGFNVADRAAGLGHGDGGVACSAGDDDFFVRSRHERGVELYGKTPNARQSLRRHMLTSWLRGSNASRNPSPSRLNASVADRTASPGQTTSHGLAR